MPLLKTASIIWLSLLTAGLALAQADDQRDADASQLTVTRICTDKDFKTRSFGPSEWLNDGDAYTTVEEVAAPDAAESEDDLPKEIVKYDTATGTREVLVSIAQLTPTGKDKPLTVDDYDWSQDKTKLLIFTNTVKVWRDNTRGDYWLLDLETGSLRQIAASAKPSTLMFAKLSPDATRVAYVRENNIYVESLGTGTTVALTSDGTKTLINGTFDWVYEEELGLQDGFRWSPDGQRIAYWQLDASVIKTFYMINNTDENYPKLIPLPYPKVGERNSSARIGVVSATGGPTQWMAMPGDPSENYLASLEWVSDSRNLLIEQLNRLQNRRVLWRVDATSGSGVSIYTDVEKAWIDMRQKFPWYKSDTHRLVLSESDGWRHAYRVAVKDGAVTRLTPGEYDVIDLIGNDTQWLYFTASPTDPIRQYLYRAPLDGGPAERVTPDDQVGFHTYNAAPNGKWAIHTFSAMGKPPVIDLVELPSHRSARVLEENAEASDQLAQLTLGEREFFRVSINNPDTEQPHAIDGWMIKPPGFDPSKKYPIIMHVYTEPWGQTARDVWGGDRYMWHLLLSQHGYIVATVDNRGTPAPRGRAWRKAIYRKIGIVNVSDQAAATSELLKRPYIDDQRVGVWGWSGGGSMTLNAMFQHPELYHVGISVAPVGDQRLYDTIYQERYMGLPKDNEEGFTQGSPVTHAHKLQGKLMLIHGTGDDNVHYQNAERVINELIKHNRPFDMMSYPNRSHSIKEGDNTRQHLYELMTRYFTTNLPAGGK